MCGGGRVPTGPARVSIYGSRCINLMVHSLESREPPLHRLRISWKTNEMTMREGIREYKLQNTAVNSYCIITWRDERAFNTPMLCQCFCPFVLFSVSIHPYRTVFQRHQNPESQRDNSISIERGSEGHTFALRRVLQAHGKAWLVFCCSR